MGKYKLSKNVLFNANKHVFHCEKSLATLFYGQPSYINDIPQLAQGRLITFADNTSILTRGQDINELQNETAKNIQSGRVIFHDE
jgi:hypothetical protein